MLAASLHFGDIAVGVTGKYINHSLASKLATGFGFDLGASVSLFKILNIGFVLQDVGAQLSWNTDSNVKETIPLTTRGGVAFKPDFIPIVLSTEVVKIGKGDIMFKAGGEYRILDFFGVRAGYDGDNVSFGGLVRVPVESFAVQVDYAATRDALESSFIYHIALSILF
jgi:hypothetical protein